MTDDDTHILQFHTPTPDRPLLGMTVLVVEDSRFASEAIRLLCLRSGARIRRADCLRSAHRHLGVYRPTVVIVDLGLPDGSGTELIRDLAAASPRVGVILGMSAEPAGDQLARDAGADGFIEKPIESLAEFQAQVLRHLPVEAHPKGLRVLGDDGIDPDPLALLDDLSHVTELLTSSHKLDRASIGYAVQFLTGLARTAHDQPLHEMAVRLSAHHACGEPISGDIARIAGMVHDRMADRKVV